MRLLPPFYYRWRWKMKFWPEDVISISKALFWVLLFWLLMSHFNGLF